MNRSVIHNVIIYLSGLVWLINGLFCKVLNLVPRHQQIVERVLQIEEARALTVIIGILEVLMTLWIFSKYKSGINVIVQMIAIGSMNIIEAFYAPELLLWGYWNSVFALLFLLILYYNRFVLGKQYYPNYTA